MWVLCTRLYLSAGLRHTVKISSSTRNYRVLQHDFSPADRYLTQETGWLEILSIGLGET